MVVIEEDVVEEVEVQEVEVVEEVEWGKEGSETSHLHPHTKKHVLLMKLVEERHK